MQITTLSEFVSGRTQAAAGALLGATQSAISRVLSFERQRPNVRFLVVERDDGAQVAVKVEVLWKSHRQLPENAIAWLERDT